MGESIWTGRAVFCLVIVVAIACGDSSRSGDAGDQVGGDAGPDAGSTADGGGCREDADCDDGLFCNGPERCAPQHADADARGCTAGEAPACDDGISCTSDRCSEAQRDCAHIAVDADGDGHADADCVDGAGLSLGDDCDDADANRFPDNTEVCDDAGHDEDCDLLTLGGKDSDTDDFVDQACCNPDGEGGTRCGDDCDDGDENVHPELTEVCDGVDNDCDAQIDEQVVVTYHRDADGDGFGDPQGTMALACSATRPPGWVDDDTDCDDDQQDVNPAAVEVCDGIDNNCNTLVDGDDAPDCPCTLGEERACGYRDGNGTLETRGRCQPGLEICVLGAAYGSRWGGCTGAVLPEAETCDNTDEDCNGVVDDYPTDPLTFYADADADGFGNPLLTMSGCPSTIPGGWVTRAGDCDDAARLVNPDAQERCDAIDNDCDGDIDSADDEVECDCLPGPPQVCGPRDAGGALITAGQCSSGLRSCEEGQWSVVCVGAVDPSEETCDGVDEDCNGVVDDHASDAQLYYADADNDGRGDPADTQLACARPEGYRDLDIAVQFDCDDDDPDVYAGAPELCNGVNDDCDAGTDEDAAPSCDVAGQGGVSYACQQGGVCAVVGCPGGYDDCDGTYDNGCEQPLSTLAHCGACNNACDFSCGPGDCQELLSLSAGGKHTCARIEGGRVSCWGDNTLGQLGTGDNVVHPLPTLQDALDETLADVRALSAGGDHSCAVVGAAGNLYCFGDNAVGQLGSTLVAVGQASSTPVAVELSGVTSLSAGQQNTCAVHGGGSLSCWGLGTDGQNGSADSLTINVPVPAQGPGGPFTDAVEVSVGDGFACARVQGGALYCWGRNQYGQLGDGSLDHSADSPVCVVADCYPVGTAVQGLTSVSAIAAGGIHACALQGGQVYCWGRNDAGQLAQAPGVALSETPLAVVGVATAGTSVTSLAAGERHTCALLSNGAVRCWGANYAGQVGAGPAGGIVASPTTAVASGAVALSAGGSHSCALLGDGQAYCWGSDQHGELGDDAALGDQNTPVAIAPLQP